MKNRQTRLYSGLVLSLLGLALVTFFLSFLIGQHISTKSVNKNFQRTVEYLKKQCSAYDDVLASDRVKSLIRLTEQTSGIARQIDTDSVLQQKDTFQRSLREYMENQRLDGIMILNSSKEIVISMLCDDLKMRDYTTLLQSSAIMQVFSHRNNIYAVRQEEYGMLTDIAAVHREDDDGIVICLRIQGSQKIMPFQSTLETLLANDDTAMSGMLYITDGIQILGCSQNELHRTPVKDQPLLTALSENEKTGKLIHLQSDGKHYLGGKATYGKYTLFIIYPFEDVFASCRNSLLIGRIIYLILCLFVLFFVIQTERNNLKLLNRQYETIVAISNLYRSTIRISLEENTTSFLRRPQIYSNIPDGLSPRRLLGEQLPEYVSEEYRDRYRSFANPETLSLRLAEKEQLELVYQSIRGVWLHDIFVPVKRSAAGEVLSALLITRNIDEQKQKELAYQKQLEETSKIEAEANREKTEFLRRISHDTRTPINVIQGMVKIAQSDPGNEDKQAYCREKIDEASRFLSELVNDILVVTRKEKNEEPKTVFSLRSAIEEAVSIADLQKTDASITLLPPTIHTAHDTLQGNVLHFQQILLNLLTNAVKYNRSGGSVTLAAEEITFSEGVSTVAVSCTDTGIGMSREFQKVMFEPFAQERPADQKYAYESGLGLGLAVVKKLVTKMNGTITVDSEQDKGTRFLITLPFAIAPAREKAAAVPPLDAHSASLQGIHVLIAEDNPLNAEVAAFLLGEHGAAVTTAQSGSEALQLFEKSPAGTFNVILMDMMMPPPDGLETTRLIRGLQHPDAKTVPILAMTANLFPQDIAACREAGMNGHLGKPLDAGILVQTILSHVHGKAKEAKGLQ